MLNASQFDPHIDSFISLTSYFSMPRQEEVHTLLDLFYILVCFIKRNAAVKNKTLSFKDCG